MSRLVAASLAAALVAGCSASPPEEPAEPPPVEAGPEVREPDTPGPTPDDADGDEPDPSEPAPDDPAPEPEPEPPPVPDGRDTLVAEAERMLAAAIAEATTGDLAVLVTDEYGREIAAHAADDPLLPASTLKTVTAAAVLTTLGPRHRIATIVEATAPIDADGSVRGDLALVGAGDPVLATPEYGRWVYPARPRTPLEVLADQLVDAGLTRVEGDVLAAAPRFIGPRTPEGWPDRYFSSFDARYSDGLTVDAGLRTIVTYPEPEGSDDEDGDANDEADTTAPSDEIGEDDDGGIATPEDLDEADLGPPDVRVDHAPEPALHAVTEFVRLLDERGVEVAGEVREGVPDALIVGQLAAVESPPMIDLLRFAMQRSDNQITDGLFRLAGSARTGTGSFESGERALRQVLDRYGIDHSRAVFADGSGLSRDDRASARLLVELDRAMSTSRHGPAWASIMASMGRSGTLERRLRGSVADGRFIGKTGTLRDVTAISGAVVDDEGARYHLAVIANDAGATRGVARALADELVLLLVADVDGCSIERPGDTDGPIGLPSMVVSC